MSKGKDTNIRQTLTDLHRFTQIDKILLIHNLTNPQQSGKHSAQKGQRTIGKDHGKDYR